MDDFSKIFKDALDGHEVPFDASAWESLSGKLSPIEDAVRDAVKDHEAPYNPKVWSNIKGQIGGNSNLIKWAVGSAAAIGIIITSITALNDSPDQKIVDNPIINTSFGLSSERNILLSENTTAFDNTPSDNNENVANDQTESTNSIENIIVTTPEENIISLEEPSNVTNDGSTVIEETTPVDNLAQTDIPPTQGNDINENDAVVPNYNADFSMSASTICMGEEIIFNPREVRNDVTYEWAFGDDETSTKTNPIHTFTKSGNLFVTLTIIDKNGKPLAEEQNEITINSAPASNFRWSKENDAIPTIVFENESFENESNMIWKVNQKPITDKKEMEYTFRSKGKYIVSLQTTNENGCSTTTEREIAIDNNYNLFAPKGFTPDGDGNNDNFIPRALEIMNTDFIMTIYDQSGQLAYQTNSANAPWNGFNAATNVQEVDGSFIWVVQLKNRNGTYETYKGQVFIN